MHRLCATGLVAVLLCGGGAHAKPDAALDKRIARLIEELGNARHAIREAAHNELTRIGYPALPALQKATASSDTEVSVRAGSILDTLLAHTHAILDARGRPIAGAEVRIAGSVWGDDANKPRTFVTDAMGHVDIPPPVGHGDPVRAEARVSHAEYGVARIALGLPADQQKAHVPLVRRDSEEGKRALRGVVVGPEGKPLAGAVVRCAEIRTPGEGLIEPVRGQVALTDERGGFRIYPLPSRRRADERGELIPRNSTFRVRVSHEADESLFPRIAKLNNTAEAEVQLLRPARRFQIRFEGLDGKPLTDAKTLAKMVLCYEEHRELGRVALPARYVTEGAGGLVPGTYHVQADSLRYVPLTVDAGSPETLTFRLAPPVTFAGRVLHGVTGRAIEGALVAGCSGTAHNNLAMLTDDDWEALDGLPARPAADHDALKPVAKMYGLLAAGRTDGEGRFELTQPLAKRFYSVMAFAKDYVPFKSRTYAIEIDGKDRAAVGDLPLYPAAKVFVRPVLAVTDAGRNVSVSPRWRLLEHGQPDWVGRFRKALPYQSVREYEYIHWMKLNQRQPVHVPAGVLLKLALELPYDDQWTTATVNRVVLLKQGESLDLGEVGFRKALRAQVRVVDKDGKPVDGAPVRRLHKMENVWSVAHNTNADGLASFYVDANSTGQFRVLATDCGISHKVTNTVVPFKVGKAAPTKPYVIRLTEEQVRIIRGLRKKRPARPKAPKVEIRN